MAQDDLNPHPLPTDPSAGPDWSGAASPSDESAIAADAARDAAASIRALIGWRVEAAPSSGARTLLLHAEQNDAPVSMRAVFAALAEEEPERAALIRAMTRLSLIAYFFETPPWSSRTADAPFVAALTESSALARVIADPSVFEGPFERWRATRSDVIARFANLGGDATLLAPLPFGPERSSAAGHLGRFLSGAPHHARHALWRAVGAEALARLGARPLWISTSGLGAPWLHVRFDERPKYYAHGPFTRWPPAAA